MEPPKDPYAAWKELQVGFLQGVAEETFRDRGVQALDWTEHYSTLIDLGKTILQNTDSRQSLVAARMLEMFKQLLWVHHSVLNGAYHSAIRDLRFILESIVSAYTFWKEHPDISMDEKYDFLVSQEEQRIADGERHRAVKDVFRSTRLSHWPALYELYGELSKYSHPSANELKDMLRPVQLGHRVAFRFHAPSFEVAHDLSNRTMDAWSYVLISRFPVAASALKDAITLDTLRALDQRLTLELGRQPRTNR